MIEHTLVYNYDGVGDDDDEGDNDNAVGDGDDDNNDDGDDADNDDDGEGIADDADDCDEVEVDHKQNYNKQRTKEESKSFFYAHSTRMAK